MKPELGEMLGASDLITGLRDALEPLDARLWVVGGTVRDALLGHPLGDVDLAIAGDAGAAAKLVARRLGGSPFELSDEFGTWRVTGPGHEWSVDIAELRGGGGIETDLALRDFSLNSVAYPLDAVGGAGEAVDPCGGLEDLERGVLRASSERTFEDDPLRLARMARMAASFGLTVDEGTIRLARGSAGRAGEPAGERVFAELRGMMTGPDPLRALKLLDQVEATSGLLPELDALRDVEQSANHHLDVHDHTIEVLRRWLAVETDLETYAGDSAEEVAARLDEPLADELTRRDGIRFAAILHDIGKPATRTDHGGFIGFRGHDTVGAEMIGELCRRLRTSRRTSSYLSALTRHHLILGFMIHERPLARRRVFDYLETTGAEALDVTLLTVADRLSAQGSGVPREMIESHLELAREMLAEIVKIERDGYAEPLLDGREITDLLDLEPGGRVGAAVRELAAAQFAGEVSSREEAEGHLRAWDDTGDGDAGASVE